MRPSCSKESELIADRVEPAPDVGDGHGGPVGEVLDRRGPVTCEVAQGQPGQRRIAIERLRLDAGTDAVGVPGVGVLALAGSATDGEAAQLEVRHEQHHHATGDSLRQMRQPVAQRRGHLLTRPIRSGRQEAQGGVGELPDVLGRQAEVTEQLAVDHPEQARTGQGKQPVDVAPCGVVPGWAQHVGADCVPRGEESVKITGVRRRRPGGHGPRGLAGVLRLHGEQRVQNRARRAGVRRGEELVRQTPPGNRSIVHHAIMVMARFGDIARLA